MNLPKAIEIIQDLLDFGLDSGFPDTEASLKLGIEALKVFSELAPMFRVPPFGILPGETEK